MAIGWWGWRWTGIPCCEAIDLCCESECDADEIGWRRPIRKEGNLTFYLPSLPLPTTWVSSKYCQLLVFEPRSPLAHTAQSCAHIRHLPTPAVDGNAGTIGGQDKVGLEDPRSRVSQVWRPAGGATVIARTACGDGGNRSRCRYTAYYSRRVSRDKDEL